MQDELAARSPEIRKWIAISLARGVQAQQIVGFFARRGFDRAAIAEEIDQVRLDPMFEAVAYLGARLEKYSGLADTLSRLHQLSRDGRSVPELRGIGPAEFFEEYYVRNRPAVFRGFAQHWPAVGRWTPEHLVRCVGSAPVSVCIRRDASAEYEEEFEQHVVEMPFDDFVDQVIVRSPTNDIYLAGRNFAFGRPEFRPLLADIVLPAGIIEETLDHRAIKLWFGPAGTVTPLHHDCISALFVQIFGRKRFLLAPALEWERMKNDHGVYSDVDPERPNGRSADYPGEDWLDVTVGPGDALFLPVGWWHHVRSLDISISVTLQNFAVPEGNTRWKRGYWVQARFG